MNMLELSREASRIAMAVRAPYRRVMEASRAYLELEIDVREPIELSDFVRTFTSFGEQYERYLSQNGYAEAESARIYIKRIREGSIIAELVPIVFPLIQAMDASLIVRDFGRMVRDRITPYFVPGGQAEGASKSEIKSLMNGVAAIAKDSDGKARLTSVRLLEDGEHRELLLEFNSRDANVAVRQLEEHYELLSLPASERYENVLMVFFQSNKRMPGTEQKSGEQAVISSIHSKPRPIVYASNLARERIKDEIFHGNENLYKRGFYVDVEVDRYAGKIAAYKIMAVREIIDLPDDD